MNLPTSPALRPAQEILAQQTPARPSVKERNANAAKQFEGMLMAFMFQSMRQTVPTTGLFGDESNTRTTYEYLLDQAVTTKAMNAGKGYGLAQRLEAQWNRQAGP